MAKKLNENLHLWWTKSFYEAWRKPERRIRDWLELIKLNTIEYKKRNLSSDKVYIFIL